MKPLELDSGALYDMLRFHAATMLAVMRDLQRAEDHIMIHGLTKPADDQMSEDEKYELTAGTNLGSAWAGARPGRCGEDGG